MTPEFLTPKEVASWLRVSTVTIYRLIRARQLKAVPVGRRALRISADEVTAYIKRQQGKAQPELIQRQGRLAHPGYTANPGKGVDMRAWLDGEGHVGGNVRKGG